MMLHNAMVQLSLQYHCNKMDVKKLGIYYSIYSMLFQRKFQSRPLQKDFENLETTCQKQKKQSLKDLTNKHVKQWVQKRKYKRKHKNELEKLINIMY